MTKMHNVLKTTRLSIWLIMCVLILAATSVYAAGNERPLAAVDILGSPDAAVNGQFAVGTTTPGSKALTVAGVIDFVGAGTVHNYFTQGPGNNMQIRSNVDEYNAVGNGSYAQWNMVMGASLDVFSIRRSPASSTYNEDALFWIEGSTGNVGISKVDTSNGATIPFTLEARLHVETDSGDAIYGISSATSGDTTGIYGEVNSTAGYAIYGFANATSGGTIGVYGVSMSTGGAGVMGIAAATSGTPYGVYGESSSSFGRAVYGYASATNGGNYGVYGVSDSTGGYGVRGHATATSGTTFGVSGVSSSPGGRAVNGYASASTGTNYGVYGRSDSTAGIGVYGYVTPTSGSTVGVFGESYSSSGYGVYGEAHSTDGFSSGIFGRSGSSNGAGVYGWSSHSTGMSSGVAGESQSTSGYGVYGRSYDTTGTSYGMYARADSTAGYDFYAGGVGTDYGPFTGAHEVLLSDTFPSEIQEGMIVSATGETHIRQLVDGGVDLSSTLPTVRLADRAEDKAVLGVLVAEIALTENHWYAAQDGDRFASVNALGEGRVWVTDINGDIEAGDAITTSEIP